MIKIVILIIFILFIWAFFIEPNLITTKKYHSDDFYGKKIVFVSDLHISKNDMSRLKRIIEIINKQNPDIVLCGGDYIKGHSGKQTMDINKIAKELSKIKAPVVSVLGNHDGWYDKYRVKTALEKNGISVLSNSNIRLNDITIAGVEDLQTGSPNPGIALAGTEHPKILISHTPDIFYDIKEDTDLILAGHVHGGQFRLPGIGALIVPSKYGNRFACGIYEEENKKMIVTKGLGTSIMNMRFNTLPEIVIIE